MAREYSGSVLLTQIWMKVTDPPLWLGIANLRHGLYGLTTFLQPETATFKNLLIAADVQIGEAIGELNLLVVKVDGTICTLALCAEASGNVRYVHREKPADPRGLILKEAGRLDVVIVVNYVGPNRAENEIQHINVFI